MTVIKLITGCFNSKSLKNNLKNMQVNSSVCFKVIYRYNQFSVFFCILEYFDIYYLLINVVCDRIVTPDVGGCNTGREGSVIYPVSA